MSAVFVGYESGPFIVQAERMAKVFMMPEARDTILKRSPVAELAADALKSWAIKTRGMNLGYPTCSAEYRINTGGVMSASTDLTAEDERTDRAVAVLKLRHKKIHYRMIDLWYLKGLKMDTIIEMLHVSRSNGYVKLRDAEERFWRVRQGL